MLSVYLLNEGSKLLAKKWRFAILYKLGNGPLRFTEIKKLMGEKCSVKVLSEALDEMEQYGIIVRKQYQQIPVKVTYEVSIEFNVLNSMINDYYKVLVLLVYKNKDRLDIPSNILQLLEQISTGDNNSL